MSSATGRERILSEAAELFLSNGYGDTSLRDIAAAVGIQPASIYHHFGSKEELFTEILRIGIAHTTNAFDAVASTPGTADPAARLGRHIEAHLQALFEHRPFTAANVVVFPVAPRAVQQTIIPYRDAYEARWDSLFTSLAEHDALSQKLDTKMARRITLGAINSTIEWFSIESRDQTSPDQTSTDQVQDYSINDLATVTTDLVWRGIGLSTGPQEAE